MQWRRRSCNHALIGLRTIWLRDSSGIERVSDTLRSGLRRASRPVGGSPLACEHAPVTRIHLTRELLCEDKEPFMQEVMRLYANLVLPANGPMGPPYHGIPRHFICVPLPPIFNGCAGVPKTPTIARDRLLTNRTSKRKIGPSLETPSICPLVYLWPTTWRAARAEWPHAVNTNEYLTLVTVRRAGP